MRRILAVALLQALAVLHAAEFWVAPTGDDRAPGTRARPFATLERARDAVRALPSRGGARVWLRGGIYPRTRAFELDARDSGQPGAPVVYAAWGAEKPRLVGGRVIPASAFRPVTDQAFLDRVISRAARRHLLQADLKALSITDYGEHRPMHAVDFGSSTHYLPAPLELFIDAQAATLARWPNRNDAAPFLGVVDSASQQIEKDENGNPKQYSTFVLKDVPTTFWGYRGDGDMPALFPKQALEHIREWGALEDVFVVGGLIRAYATTRQKISAVDAKTGAVTFATPLSVWPTYKDMTRLFYFTNLPEEIDVP